MPRFCYIRYMSNITNRAELENRQDFILEMARLLVPWGVPETAARLYGYLLLSDGPVSLDNIVADLGVSKSTASVAARLLEMYTLARRRSQGGTSRILFEASEDYDGMLRAQTRSLEQLADLLQKGAQATRTKATRDRLKVMAEFYLVNRNAMESALRKWAARK